MKKYEYKTVLTDAKGVWGGKVDMEEYQTSLNELGAQGWQVVGTVASNQSYGNTRYLLTTFMREISL